MSDFAVICTLGSGVFITLVGRETFIYTGGWAKGWGLVLGAAGLAGILVVMRTVYW